MTTSSPSVQKDIFVDTNIWMYLFGNIGKTNNRLVKKYSYLFNNLRKSKAIFHTDVSVISEFVNRYLRIAYYIYCRNNGDCDFKKDYRKTSDYKNAWDSVCHIVNHQILSIAKPIDAHYDSLEMKTILKKGNFDRDFNDNHIVFLCKKKKLVLFTHDGDFKSAGINIISENNIYS